MNPCEHIWVMYQPLIGEAFECCSKCPMTKAEYDALTPDQIISIGTDGVTFIPLDLTLPAGFYFQDAIDAFLAPDKK